jgi:hypothetical protein
MGDFFNEFVFRLFNVFVFLLLFISKVLLELLLL